MIAESTSAQTKEITWLTQGTWVADSVCYQRVHSTDYDSCIHIGINDEYYQFRAIADTGQVPDTTSLVMDITGMDLDPESNSPVARIEHDDPYLFFEKRIDNGFQVFLYRIETREHVQLIEFSENAFSMIHLVNGIPNRVHYRKIETPAFKK